MPRKEQNALEKDQDFLHLIIFNIYGYEKYIPLIISHTSGTIFFYLQYKMSYKIIIWLHNELEIKALNLFLFSVFKQSYFSINLILIYVVKVINLLDNS